MQVFDRAFHERGAVQIGGRADAQDGDKRNYPDDKQRHFYANRHENFLVKEAQIKNYERQRDIFGKRKISVASKFLPALALFNCHALKDAAMKKATILAGGKQKQYRGE
ncbi:hypothetical protein AGMMS49959_00690 [Planctomycetales bacterium]|nr:hypothetical protein AGMMS49959_00690 [Planctomycetales bacterium]